MVHSPNDEDSQTTDVKKIHGNSFTIEDDVIKGVEKYWNDDRHVGQIIFSTLSEDPNHVGMIDAVTDEKITFADMKEKSVRLAIWLKKQGFGPGDIISLLAPNIRDVYSIVFATFFIGATYNTMEHDINTMTARCFVRATKPKVIFTHPSKLKILKETLKLEEHKCQVIVMGEGQEFEVFDEILKKQSIEEIEKFEVISEINPESINMIAFSSGTTGTPKAIAHLYGQVMQNVLASGIDDEIYPEEHRHLTYFYPSWAVAMWFLLDFIVKKATQIFHETFELHETCKIIERYKVNAVSLDTHTFMFLCTDELNDKFNRDSVKIIIPVGTKLTTNAMQKIHKNFPYAFISKRMGLSETGELTRYTKDCSNPLSEGIVRPNVQLKIVDLETGKKLGQNQVGELCVKGPTVMSHYYKNPTETQRTIDREGWLHSGDNACYDENGELIIIGRIKEMIRYRNVDVHPTYLEELLLSHPDITEAAVIGVPHEIDIERPIAFVKTNPESKVTKYELSKIALQFEYSDMLENSIEFIDRIPRNTNGKINKKLLKELARKFYE